MFSFLCCAVVFASFYKGFAEDVTLTMDKTCYNEKDSMTLTAKYGGSDTLAGVEWYYSGRLLKNIILQTDCTVFQTDTGFPIAKITFKCPPLTADSNTFQLVLDNLSQSDLDNVTWGATFQVSGTTPALKTVQPKPCDTTTPPPEPCGCPWWVILIIVIGCLYLCGIVIGIFMFCCKDEPWNKIYVGDKTYLWIFLLIIVIVGLGILTVYLICKGCGRFYAKNESEPDSMQEKMKMAEDLASHDQDKNAL